MRSRASRSLAMLVGPLFMAALVVSPAQADPIPFGDVVQSFGGLQYAGQNPDLRLRTASQGGNSAASGAKQGGSTQSPSSIISGTTVSGGQGNVETIEQGDISGTICDCGEIIIPGGGFPLWPLLGLAAIPIPFIPGHESTPPETPVTPPLPTPTPTPPPASVPEPASLLLFGTGLAALGAGVRRRYMRTKLSHGTATTTEA